MAKDDPLAILKQGVHVWNKWRDKNVHVDFQDGSFYRGVNLIGADLVGANFSDIDLTLADFSNATLIGAHFRRAKLHEAVLTGASLRVADFKAADLMGGNLAGSDLWRAKFQDANLTRANLRGANLSKANLNRANLNEVQFVEANLQEAQLDQASLREANMYKANLTATDLRGTDFRQANLRGTNLSEAKLNGADLTGADLVGTNFAKARVGITIFGNSNLGEAIGLEDVFHDGPSTIGTDTLAISKGKIPEVFLKGCGLSDWEIEHVKLYSPNLSNEEINKILYKIYELRATQALQISPLFIAYSHIDSAFIDKIEKPLNNKGIRFWRDIHDMKAGRIEPQIDRAISQNRTVLLVLSKHSLSSDWVEHEVRTARGLEKDMGHDVLCPVALDDSWKDSKWEKRIMEQVMKYNILDFSAWEDDVKFDGMFRKLIDGLQLFYKG